ncbi:protein kinase family protein [Nocardioides sp. R-C-SC26]|uniref:protein kinase family protein n=1 Tax=Nocardioides sp. R-C-SC26 TaxID=2870414 RepID=UPI001E61BC87|nr:protein kinase family protein [Nocardioides sp. R-C-SC26]
MPTSNRPGDVLADRYRLVDLLSESGGGRFWRAHDRMLERYVAIHVIAEDDARAPQFMDAARRSATVLDRRILRVLDADHADGMCFVVNEWGWGTSLDVVANNSGPLGPRRAAWVVSEVADSLTTAHAAGVGHGRLNPENVLIDAGGGLHIIGFCIDAALHGVDADGALERDIHDVAGLLYCALTAKWPGRSGSLVAQAPSVHGQVLRPRQVRAGVPRQLDALCEAVLTAQPHERIPSMRAIRDELRDFVGDATGVAQALAASVPRMQADEGEQIVLPPVPEVLPHDSPEAAGMRDVLDTDQPPLDRGTASFTDTGTGALSVSDAAPASAEVDVPTEAGLPIFGDEDDVSWLERRTSPVPPPPPFEEPPERPLFAPTPTDGGPARKPREGATPPTGIRPDDEHWPFGPEAQRGRPATRPRPPAPVALPGGVPGRSWQRLAGVLLVVLLLAVALVVALTLRGGESPEEPSATPSGSSSQAPAPVLEGLSVTVLDPLGTDGGVENDDQAPNAVDGDPATTWSTQGYNDQLGPPPGLKTGVGLVVDLGGSHDVTSVELAFATSPTSATVFAADVPPAQVDDITAIGSGTAENGSLTVTPGEGVSASYLVIWLTALPLDPSDNRYRGQLAEVVVRGR